MQPQDPQASPDPVSNAPEAASSEASTESSKSPSWWQRLTGRGGGEADGDESKPQGDPDPAAEVLTLTRAELDRQIQSETDRRENKRREARTQEERRELRRTDPWAYAQQEEEAESRQQTDQEVGTLLGQIASVHDQYTLSAALELLPQSEQQRLLAIPGAGNGLDGRKLLMQETIKAIQKQARDEGARDAEKKLRTNPAFRKDALRDMRRGYPDPELLPTGTSTDETQNVSQILRQRLGAHRSL